MYSYRCNITRHVSSLSPRVPENNDIDKMETNSRDPKGTQLKATKIDFCVAENSKAHHTDEYEIEDLIVRRGQEFKIIVTFNKPVNAEKDQIILQLATGLSPKESKKSIIRLEHAKSLSTSSWGMQIVNQRGPIVEMSVISPAHAFVGKYTVDVKTKGYDEKDESNRKQEDKIYVLFNAWCKDDSVFMENEDHRQEYVLNDHGRIWIGNQYRHHGKPWNFGQFEDVSLETCLKLLDMAGVKAEARGSPVRICRTISQMVNSQDDNGVLVGNWTRSYEGGASPSSWIGSVAILRKFSESKESVKYGQCWVFSGVTTTLLRAIGIPTRSVTNFASAHDTDKSLTIDNHVDEDGKPIDSMNTDSVWNFHVWNESHFTRPDLPSGYDGWQAHDATPQETSEKVYQCGPCPVKAIKNGELYVPYDAGFVFAEVNGDRVYWEVNARGEMSVNVIDKKSVGKLISTKAVGSNQREDLTNMYKFPEGSQEERNAVQFANKFSSRKDEEIYIPETPHDVDFEIKTSHEVMIGDNFDIKLAIKNTSMEPRTVTVNILTKASFYTGVVAEDLKNKKEEMTIAGKEETTVILPIMFEDYMNIPQDASLRTYFKAKVKETGQVFLKTDDEDFDKPKLEANIPDRINMFERFQITFTFTNPLPVKLTNGKLILESHGMLPSTMTEVVRRDIQPHAKVSIPVIIKCKRQGRRYLDAAFHSDQLSGVEGEFEFRVRT